MTNARGSRGGGLLVVIAALALSTWVYFTPHLALRAMRRAADERNAAALAEYVDFPSLRESLKAGLGQKMAQAVPPGGGFLTTLGLTLAGAFADPAIDALVTPQSLALLLRGWRPGTAPPAGSPLEGVDVDAGYVGVSDFRVTLTPKDAPSAALRLRLRRDGFVAWKLVAVELP